MQTILRFLYVFPEVLGRGQGLANHFSRKRWQRCQPIDQLKMTGREFLAHGCYAPHKAQNS
jgi:hypothetical protein